LKINHQWTQEVVFISQNHYLVSNTYKYC